MGGAREPERLSAADASNVVIDAPDQVNAFLLAGILGAGGFVSRTGEPDVEMLRAAIGDRIASRTAGVQARLSRRVRTAHGGLVWESCPPDLTWHVRLVDPVDGPTG